MTLRKKVHYKTRILFETAPGMQVLVGPQGWNDGVEVSGGGGGGHEEGEVGHGRWDWRAIGTGQT